MPRIARVVVVFNPQSSGDGEQLAGRLRDRLTERRPDLPVELVATEHAGHGRELAAEHGAGGTPDAVVLIVSASGDGGYHDVVNGVLDAGGGAAGVAAAVLPAGNANDHHRAVVTRPLDEAVAADDLQSIDLLTLQRSDRPAPEYAHSYIGVGVTAAVAVGLEESGGKGSIGEVLTTLRVLRRLVPVALVRDGRRRAYDAVVASTVGEMAKFVTLDPEAVPDDGRFEVVELGHLRAWQYPGVLLRALTGRLLGRRGVTTYGFRTTAVTPVQLDGEVRELAAGVDVTVGIAAGALLTVR